MTAAAGTSSWITRAKCLHALVEFEIHRAVQMIGRQTGLRRGTLAERQEQVWVRVVGEHHRDRSLDV